MKTDSSSVKSETAVPQASGTTIPARELRLLLEGVREWYLGVHSRTTVTGLPGLEVEGPGIPVVGALSGATGQGKSLLVQALKQICSALEVRFASTNCPARAVEPLVPVLNLIQSLYFCLDEGQRKERLSDQHRAHLEYLGCSLVDEDQGDSQKSEQLAALSPDLDRSRTVCLLAETVIALSEGPQLLVIEDLHLIDEMSKQVLSQCVRLARRCASEDVARALLFVVTYRQEDLAAVESREPLLQTQSLAFEIDCRGYSRTDVQDACSSNFSGGLALSVRQEIYRRTAGNPALVLWTLQALRHVEGKPVLGGLPPDLESLVLQSFERLNVGDRGVLFLLAFLSRPRTARDLHFLASELVATSSVIEAIVSGCDSFEIEIACRRLASRGWLRSETSGVENETAWALASADVSAIVRQTRGSGTAEIFLDEVGRVLAGLDEIEVSPFEVLDHLHGRPKDSLFKEVSVEAARLSELRGDVKRSVEIRDRLIECLDVEDGEFWFELCLEQAASLEVLGVYGEAIELYRSLTSGRFREATAEEKAGFQRKIASLYSQQGDGVGEVGAYKEGLASLEGLRGSEEDLKIRACLVVVQLGSGDANGSQVCCEELLADFDFFRESGRTVPREVFECLEEYYFRTGQYSVALEFEEQICAVCAAEGDIEGEMKSLLHLSHLYVLERGEKRSYECLTRALELSRVCASRSTEADIHVELGSLLLSSSRKEEALASFEEACGLLVDLGIEERICQLRGMMANVQFQLLSVEGGLGNLESYVRLSDTSRPKATGSPVFPPIYNSLNERDVTVRSLQSEIESGDFSSAGLHQQRLADLLVDQGRLKEAARLYHEALRCPRVKGNVILVAILLQRLGRLYRLEGQFVESLKFFEKSLQCLGPVPEKSVVGNVYLEVGQVRLQQGDLSRSFDYLVRGLGIFLDIADPQGVTVSLVFLARYMREVGCSEFARRLASCARELAVKKGFLRWEVHAGLIFGTLLGESGDIKRSQRVLARVSMLAETLGLDRHLAWLGVEEGWQAVRSGEHEGAQRRARDCLEFARRLGDQDLIDASMHLLGVVESLRGNRSKNFLRAIELLQGALKGTYRRKCALRTRSILMSMARVYVERDKNDLALKYLQEEQDLADVVAAVVPSAFLSTFQNESLCRVTRNEAKDLPNLVELFENLRVSRVSC